ncbi:acyltransferase ChoActase/COT/CPT [Gigaspora margarita]|uniref:Acyltransferase ChoActase/COT/CPT n=1 Tax=Gigaspora margarita TaxID=4874 RepID=A0A8H3XDB6_GIGMA|nr:acyltransferase ChoActase/COT/CPT [Gigaspora margarita]
MQFCISIFGAPYYNLNWRLYHSNKIIICFCFWFQREKDFLQTNTLVGQFLENEGPKLQEKLQSYATDKPSYIEEFWYDSYLSYTDPVVLNFNPFFVLANDPTAARNNQVSRAASLIFSSLNFVHALRTETLEPDAFRGTPLDMSQFQRMFGTARLPTEKGFGITEKELVANLKTIKQDAQGIPVVEIAVENKDF